MPREVTDGDGTTWTCIQAFAGLGGSAAKARAARVEGASDRVHVVCTPSGGVKSVRVEGPEGGEGDVPDEQLLAAVEAQRAQDAQAEGRPA